MRIPDYSLPIKVNYLSPKKRRVKKIREDKFGWEVEEALHQKESEAKKKNVSSLYTTPRFMGNRTS